MDVRMDARALSFRYILFVSGMFPVAVAPVVFREVESMIAMRTESDRSRGFACCFVVLVCGLLSLFASFPV